MAFARAGSGRPGLQALNGACGTKNQIEPNARQPVTPVEPGAGIRFPVSPCSFRYLPDYIGSGAMALGGLFVIQGRASFGTLLAFLGYVGGLFGPVQGLTGIYQTIQKAYVSLDDIFLEMKERLPRLETYETGGRPSGKYQANLFRCYCRAAPACFSCHFTKSSTKVLSAAVIFAAARST